MAKYRDTTKCNLPADIDYRPEETATARHDRRYLGAVRAEDSMWAFCRNLQFAFRILNEGQHWEIRRGNISIDWWPRTAKLVVNKHWDRAIHVQDVRQLKSYLAFLRLTLERR